MVAYRSVISRPRSLVLPVRLFYCEGCKGLRSQKSLSRARAPLIVVSCVLLVIASFMAAAAATSEPPEPSLTASPNVIKQRVTLSDGTRTGGEATFAGAGFAAGAIVSLFVTYPDGTVIPAVNLNSIGKTLPCCLHSDQTVADGTGSFSFTLRFGTDTDIPHDDATPGSFASTRGRAVGQVFLIRNMDTNAVPPNGVYAVTATGSRPSASVTPTPIPATPDPERETGNTSTADTTVTATATITIQGSTRDDFSRTTTASLLVFTTIGHQTSGKHFDVDSAYPSDFDKHDYHVVAQNPNVDVACNGLIPGEGVTYWDTYPDGSVYWLTTIVADDGGSAFIQVELLTGGFPTGLHTFSCRGNTSNYVLSGSFLVLPGDAPFSSQSPATVQPRPTGGTKIPCKTNDSESACRPKFVEPGSTPAR